MMTIGVIEQTRLAFRRQNRLAFAIGSALGGLVPIATFVVAHDEHGGAFLEPATALIAGGVVYSAMTVFQWATRAFQSRAKALGFVVLVEGVMLVSTTSWLALAALATLVFVNAVATACNLATEQKVSRPRATRHNRRMANSAPASSPRLKAV